MMMMAPSTNKSVPATQSRVTAMTPLPMLVSFSMTMLTILHSFCGGYTDAFVQTTSITSSSYHCSSSLRRTTHGSIRSLLSSVSQNESADDVVVPSVTITSTTTTTTSSDGVVDDKEEEPAIYYQILPEGNPTNIESIISNGASTGVQYPTINGWSPKEDYALWGLPGAIAPLGYFDPLGFARRGTSINDVKRLREAETQHGRVAMLAVVGYLSSEYVSEQLDGGILNIVGPANDQLQQVPSPIFWTMTALIATIELSRARKGWVEPKLFSNNGPIGSGTLWTLRDTYYPGDVGFDPLKLKPMENYAFQRMQTKELSHGRLAMIGWAGMCAQELVTHQTIGETWNIFLNNVL